MTSSTSPTPSAPTASAPDDPVPFLRPVGRDDAEWILPITGHWAASHDWSPRGFTASPLFVDAVIALAQTTDDARTYFAVGCDGGGRPVGLFQAVTVDPISATGELHVLIDDRRAATVRKLLAQFLRRAFPHCDLRKLHLRMADRFDATTYLEQPGPVAGRLTAHDRAGRDRYDDLLVYELWREEAP
jgi:hypothetical protein